MSRSIAKTIPASVRLGLYLAMAGTFATAKAGGQEAIRLVAVQEREPSVSGMKMSPADQAEIARLIAQVGEAKRDPARTQLPGTAAHWLSRVTEQVTVYPVVNVEFKDADTCRRFEMAGTTVITKFDRFADLFLGGLDVLAKLIHDPGVVWVERASDASAPPPRVWEGFRSRAPAESIVRNGMGKELTGKRVVIAIVDTGLDFHNPDFIAIDKDGKPVSRLRFFWDTLRFSYEKPVDGVLEVVPPVRYPNNAPIGRIYTREELTAELRSPRMSLPVWDTDGHGTACAGIAAGNGKGSQGKYAGVAPEADIIAVRIGEGHSLETAYLLNCICGWLDEKAGCEPLVISCSFSGQAGGHDGFRIAERQLDARFSPDRPGRVICIAAGNEGRSPTHASIRLRPDSKTADLAWNGFDVQFVRWGDGAGVPAWGNNLVVVGTDNETVLHVRIFGAAGNLVADTDETKLPAARVAAVAALKRQLPGLLPPHAPTDAEKAQVIRDVESIVGQTSWNPGEPATLSIYLDGDRTDDLALSFPGPDQPVVYSYRNPLSGQAIREVRLPAGPGRLTVESRQGRAVRGEAYLASARGTARFNANVAEYSYLVGTPGTARNALTVASYDFDEVFNTYGRDLLLGDVTRPGAALTIGALSSYSSPGPARAGAVKPDVAAPGQFFTACAPMNARVLLRDSTGRYQVFNGTSAATPYTAGVVALLLQKKPTLTTAKLKGLIRENATWRTDNFVGNVPNASWGYGKLDVRAVRAMLKALD
jgi:subtilisin family serine protease